MKLHRKQFTTLALAALATGFLGSATAQSAYPSKTVTMVVPTAAGGTTDLSARMLAQALGPVLGQTVVVDNKGGGNGNIAASIVKRAEADGYTLLMQYSGYHVISPHITKQKQWDQGDFQPVANVISAPQIIVVRADLPVKTLPELIAYAKANPGKVNFGSSGNGSSIHLSGELFKSLAKVDMVHVPYKGSAPAVTDLMGNQIGIMFDNMPSAIQHVRSGKLVPLAVTTAKRSPELPSVPTIAEAGVPGYEATSWFGMFAPAGTPAPVLAKLNAAIVKVLAQPDVKKKINEQGAEVYSETPEQFAAFIQAESVKWGKVVKESGASLD